MKFLAAIYDLFARRLRLSNPWNYKVPVLISVTYLVMLRSEFIWSNALIAIGFAMCTIVGIAGFGYWTNDLGDRKADKKAGKKNPLAELGQFQILGILLLWLSMAILPWIIFFPIDAVGLGCLFTEFLLLVLYILPPFRLKERGLLGLIADALYAHALPALLAALTFLALTPQRSGAFMPVGIALVSWQFFLGLRNILLHQLKDEANDRRSGLRTFVTKVGEKRSRELLEVAFVPLELLSWLAFLGLLTSLTWLPIFAWPIYLAWQFPQEKSTQDLRTWLYKYMDDFYIGWFPLLILVSLCFEDWRFGALAVLHILLFKTALSPLRDRLFSWIRKSS